MLYRPTNRPTVLAARDTGETRIGGLTNIVQDGTPALLLYADLSPRRATDHGRRTAAELGRGGGGSPADPRVDGARNGRPSRSDHVLTLIDDRRQNSEVIWSNDSNVDPDNPQDWTSSATVTLTDDQDLILAGQPPGDSWHNKAPGARGRRSSVD